MPPQTPQPPYQPPTQPPQGQPPVPPQPAQQGQYDFIINPAAPPKKIKLIPSNSLPVRILLVVGGLFVLAIIAAIVMSILSKGGNAGSKTAILSIAQDQTEIIRLSTSGMENSTSQKNKNFAGTAKLTITSSQKQLLAFASDNKIKINEKQLPAKQSSDIDTQLATAKSASTYDVVFTGVMKQELTVYQQDLGVAFKTASPTGKALLQSEYKSAGLLLTQLTQAAD